MPRPNRILVEPLLQDTLHRNALRKGSSTCFCLLVGAAGTLLWSNAHRSRQELAAPEVATSMASRFQILPGNPTHFLARRMTPKGLPLLPASVVARGSQPGARAARLARRAVADGNTGPDEHDMFKKEEMLNVEDFFDKDQALTNYEKGPNAGYFLKKYGRLWPPSAPTSQASDFHIKRAKDLESDFHIQSAMEDEEAPTREYLIKHLEASFNLDSNQ